MCTSAALEMLDYAHSHAPVSCNSGGLLISGLCQFKSPTQNCPKMGSLVLKEARGLLDQGLLPNSNCATKSIGYRQGMEFLQRFDGSPIAPDAKDLVGSS